MLDLIKMLFSMEGILLLIVATYVIDDVCALGIKIRVRNAIGRQGVLNKDPDVVLLEQEIVRLEGLIVAIAAQAGSGSAVRAERLVATEVASPFAQRDEVVNATPPPMVGSGTKAWKSWADKQGAKA